MQAPEIKRVPGATQVEQASKGWSPTGNADEWKIAVRLTGSLNRPWRSAWEGVTDDLRSRATELGEAWWVIEGFKLNGRLRDHNKDVAVETMRNLKAVG